MEAPKAALMELAIFSHDVSSDPKIVRRLRADYESRVVRLRDGSLKLSSTGKHTADVDLHTVRLAALRAERRHIIEMRNLGLIGDEVMHRIEHELDLVELELR